MNKQQLAKKIWESANKMRSKIEASEYKDYILGFIFYKFLSDREEDFLLKNDFAEEDIKSVNEEDAEIVEFVQSGLGYFISYENLFSTWISEGHDFDIANVRDALSAFSRLIGTNYKRVFDGIFQTLETGLSNLGSTAKEQSKAVRDLLYLIKDIPMDDKQDYDVLGFIYEYLISNFAANAGKKAGEFYTPHEVSLLMSEIIAEHLKDRTEIKIYDPCSGSGSLLINIGKSVSKHMDSKDNIKYYAQELKKNTYNLTRMNLVMRGILPDNIKVRNGDTLEEDWPDFEDSDPIGTYEPLYVDAVTSNPPYSQKWDPTDKGNDPRYADYGTAPKGKADYAFLLHDLYHIKPDGIMTIVLPHGVLFRGGEEGTIRKNLIEKNKIDAIIGLPANIFFGTGIPTIIMVLKQKRENTDTLIIDASKGFIKEGKNNKLRACDIRKIVDAIKNRKDIDKYCKVVSRDEIRANDYNLNIPRYVDSSEKTESYDIYASMFGGIPNSEINEYEEFWNVFPSLKDELFQSNKEPYSTLKSEDVKCVIKNNKVVKTFMNEYKNAFNGFEDYLKSILIDGVETLNIAKTEEIISSEIFNRLKNIPLINQYEAYQYLNDEWNTISGDIEIIQTEGFDATKVVDPNMVIEKKDNKEVEVQEGWIGHILPFSLVQDSYLKDEVQELRKKESRLSEINAEYGDFMDSLSDDDKQRLLNDDNTAFVAKEVGVVYKEILNDIKTPEIKILQSYLEISKTSDKRDFIANHSEIDWNVMDSCKNGTYGKTVVSKYIDSIKSKVVFTERSYEDIVVSVNKLIEEEKKLKKEVKEKAYTLHKKTKDIIENLSHEKIVNVLKLKWFEPLMNSFNDLPIKLLSDFESKIDELSKKYETTYSDLEQEISKTEKSLTLMLDDLEGNDFDMLGLEEFKTLLGGK